ncbi:hypothetical protein V6R86_01345 [Sphingomonas kaistensis]|uniref:Uncharacterized protein n=1 Tax=Sphingomonas kaistensis TaxID=298708 RepID=A0ABZ2G070_9SPHN
MRDDPLLGAVDPLVGATLALDHQRVHLARALGEDQPQKSTLS